MTGALSGVLTVPNAALRTRNDVASAAAVLGIEMDTVQAQLAAGREQLRTGWEGTDRWKAGDFIVFVLRDGAPTAVPIRTGLTDLDYSEVVAGLAATDSVFMLSGLGLIQGLQGGGQRGRGGPPGGR